jgi:hypothetical protein
VGHPLRTCKTCNLFRNHAAVNVHRVPSQRIIALGGGTHGGSNMAQQTLEVSFGSVGFSKSARIGVSMERSKSNGALSVAQAEKLFCGRRLKAKIVAVPRGENVDQGKLDGFDEKIEMTSLFDVKSISVKPDSIGMTLNCALKGLDRELFANFCSRSGKLVVKASEDIPDGEDDDDDEDDGTPLEEAAEDEAEE